MHRSKMSPNINKDSVYVMLILAAVTCTQFTTASLDQCRLLNGDLHKSNEALSQASDDMWAKFDETCDSTDRCVLEVGEEQAVTRLHYKGMRGTDEYDAVKKACKALGTDEFPTSLCKVNSELEVPNGDHPVSFFATKEPVCFAYQCGENQVELVDRSPLGCNPTTHSCIIHSEHADCPARPAGAGVGNCNKFQEAIDTGVAYKQAKDSLNMAAGSYCRTPGNETNDGTVCEYEVKPIQIMVGENFRTFENDVTFLTYTDACYDAGGETCFMSLNSRIVGQVVVFNLDVTGDYNDFPVCFPSGCSHEDKEAYAKEILATNMANKISDTLKDHIMDRRLSGEFDSNEENVDINEHLIKRLLQLDSNGDPCPLGMQECDATVVDFFCTGRDGKEVQTIDLSMPDASTSRTTSTNFVAGSFLTAMAMTGVMFI